MLLAFKDLTSRFEPRRPSCKAPPPPLIYELW